MPHFMVWKICFLVLLSGNGEEIGWIGSLHGCSDEGGGGIYGVGNFLGATTWKIRFPDGIIEVRKVPSSWNNFLWPLLRFVVVRSNHGGRLVRISLSPELMSISLGLDRLESASLLHWWQKEKEEYCSQPACWVFACAAFYLIFFTQVWGWLLEQLSAWVLWECL